MVGLAENIATQPSIAGAWAELGNLQAEYYNDTRHRRYIPHMEAYLFLSNLSYRSYISLRKTFLWGLELNIVWIKTGF